MKALAVGDFSITDSSVIWIDNMKGERRELSPIDLRLRDVSFDRPVQIDFSASLDGNPVRLRGHVGPLGKEPGKGTVPLDFTVKIFKDIEIRLNGSMVDAVSSRKFDLAIEVSPFSPRKAVEIIGHTFPVKTADPKALSRVSLKTKIQGSPKEISISDGFLQIDESKLTFSVRAQDFDRPDLSFELNLDSIDLDRYLPPKSNKKAVKDEIEKTIPVKTKKIDYAPLRRLLLNGTLRIDRLKAYGANMETLLLKVKGSDGLFHLDPLTVKLYDGGAAVQGIFDLRKDEPKSNILFKINDVKSGPFLKDFLKKDILEGTAQADVFVNMRGDDGAEIKRTLNGRGDLFFNDGAIKGIDLASMARNVKAAFGLEEKGGEKPRTDFSELHIPFTIEKGIAHTVKSSLASPFLRVIASGKADIVQETLNFRVEPKLVATLKGQGDILERSGILVPVLVTGTFDSPKQTR